MIPIHPDCDETHSFAKYANEWGSLSYVGTRHPQLPGAPAALTGKYNAGLSSTINRSNWGCATSRDFSRSGLPVGVALPSAIV